ncbi:hypothetical protein FRC19_003712 [Serendipita sp. 401]|nr:hypothetical protein FRC19_003712 [Serendipita sp. 401]
MAQNPQNVTNLDLDTPTLHNAPSIEQVDPHTDGPREDDSSLLPKFPEVPKEEPHPSNDPDSDPTDRATTNLADALATPSPAHFILIEPKWDEEDGYIEDKGPLTLIEAWNGAIQRYFPNVPASSLPFTVIEGRLEEIPAETIQCDCLVSPANSFGIMDGGYDYTLSDVLRGPLGEFWTITNQVQSYLARLCRGYLPPGSCIIVPLPKDVSGPLRLVPDLQGSHKDAEGNPARQYGNSWGATSLACLPTMRVPDEMNWHRDLVYNSMWNLMSEIEKWNREAEAGDNSTRSQEGTKVKKKINKAILTGLATGCGMVGSKKAGDQMILAVSHFTRPPLVNPRWRDVYGWHNEVVDVY